MGDNVINRGFDLEMNLACGETWRWPYSTLHDLLPCSGVLCFVGLQKKVTMNITPLMGVRTYM